MTQPLIIIGTGGNAYDVLDIVEAINAVKTTWHVAGFLDDARPAGSEHLGLPILGRVSDAAKFKGHLFINAIGSDRSYLRRSDILASTGLASADFATLIHPHATVSRRAKLGIGVYVNHGCSIGGAAVIGDHVSFSPSCLIGHDTSIGDCTIVAPGACIGGFCKIGRNCYVGSRAAIRQHLSIGDGALIGMGAVVIRPVQPRSVVVGNPARPIQRIVDLKDKSMEAVAMAYGSASRVDVIVPCYRYAHFLRDCVKSVLTQEGVDVRVLVIDDASPDNTEAVGRELARNDPRIEFRRHAVNHGHIATFNEGLEWATGTYTLLLSADDLLTPGCLRRAVKLMDGHPNVGFVYGRAITTQTPGVGEIAGDASANEKCDYKIVPGSQFLDDACTSGDNVVLTPTVVVRTSLQKRLGGYRRELVHSGDFEMWMRFAAHGDVGYLNAPQAYYRVHGHNMSSQYPGVRDFEQRKAAFDALFDVYGSSIPNATQLRPRSSRSLAESAFWAGSHLFDNGDLEACRTYHELAVRMDPNVPKSGAWMRFRCKRALGPVVWSTVRPLFYRLRGRSVPTMPVIS